MADPKNTNKEYAVAAVGVSYKKPGDPGPIHLGLQGRVIALDPEEADRLLALGVIREATDEDRTREERAGALETANREASNPAHPYGGRALVDEAEHARKAYEDSRVEDLAAEADRRGLTVEGTGAGGNVVKDDLVAALVDNDASKS